MNEVFPLYSRRSVDISGNNFRAGTHTADDIEVIENWRASHNHILNTFQSNLRRHSKGLNVTVAQRLKRRNTIFDKLQRQPEMSLSRMHDIAGCRVIFESIDELNTFREKFHNSNFKHRLSNDSDKYNYILHPKESGYRGIHDVYKYGASTSSAEKWNNLSIEIQYRTKYQHAWATAVEVFGLVTHQTPKTGRAKETVLDYFRSCSEIISRAFESKLGPLPKLSNEELIDFYFKLNPTNMMSQIAAFKVIIREYSHDKNIILILNNENGFKLSVKAYSNMKKATFEYFELEKKLGTHADIVLVSSKTALQIRESFKNYFLDTEDFNNYIISGLKHLTDTLSPSPSAAR